MYNYGPLVYRQKLSIMDSSKDGAKTLSKTAFLQFSADKSVENSVPSDVSATSEIYRGLKCPEGILAFHKRNKAKRRIPDYTLSLWI